MQSRHEIEVFADYHQFYLWDASMGRQAPSDFTPEDVERKVRIAANVVVVQPVRNMDVQVVVEVHASDPGVALDAWDHVAECSVDLPNGKLEIHECTGGPKLAIDVAPGTYAVRALFGGLGTLSDDGLDGSDRYVLQLWPAPTRPLTIQKQWRG